MALSREDVQLFGRFPAHEEDRLCLPSGSVGSFLGKATSTTDYWNTVKQTNKQTNKYWPSTLFKIKLRLVAVDLGQVTGFGFGSHVGMGLRSNSGLVVS